MANEKFKVRAVANLHWFAGNEHPELKGKPLELPVGAAPVEISADLAQYLGSFPGLKVEVINPTTPPKE